MPTSAPRLAGSRRNECATDPGPPMQGMHGELLQVYIPLQLENLSETDSEIVRVGRDQKEAGRFCAYIAFFTRLCQPDE